MGAKTLTVEELDARHAKKRAELLAKQVEAARLKEERESEKAADKELKLLGAFLVRRGLALGLTGVYWHGALIGTIGDSQEENE